MDVSKYYSRRNDGSYVVHFPNSEGTSLDEINKIFSAFGKVLSIDDRGLCFVRYQHLMDAKTCVESLQNHPFIKILPHKNKISTESKQKQNLNKKTKESCKSQLKNTMTSKSFKKDVDDQKYSESVCSENSCTNSLKSIDNDNHSSRTSPLKHFVNKDTKRNKSSRDEDEIPSLISNDQIFMSDNECSTWNGIAVPAHEVIVANVHPKFGIHYILHLFEKYNPISASFMTVVPKAKIRYCHVYFQTPEEALAVEKEFDTQILHGNNLIVLRSQKLMQDILLT
ncbi:uncharacterized protein LOC122398507 [Colletes gigas]|uniref:uncharacterized protein LOC122398507 n=1 Tax=Colletes gigas TaxID=935657 RepID=UPI001C9AE8C3|nr:uncharacterized protein LOC122398507 [Colletes gigas]